MPVSALAIGAACATGAWWRPLLDGFWAAGGVMVVMAWLMVAVPRLPSPVAWAASGAFALGTGLIGWAAGVATPAWLLPVAAALFGQVGFWIGTQSRATPPPRKTEPRATPSTSPLTIPPSERRALGRYTVDRVLGQGAMGAVYLGRDPKIGRAVAIKTMALSKEFAGDALAEARNRFFREAETAGRLQHRDIVTIFDAGEDQGLAYIAMEYLKGSDLQRHTQPGSLLSPDAVVRITARVAEALAYAHSQGVVHRDIKPANVMVDLEGDAVKVTDFGIARITDSSRTRTGVVLGTPSFMSPEQMSGLRVDGRSDLYSLGVMLFQLLTGRLPHRADSMATLMHQIANTPAADIRSLRPELPAGLAAIVAGCLEKNPNARPADGQQLAAELLATLPTLNAAGGENDTNAIAAPPDSSGFAATVKWDRDEPGHNS